MKRAKVGWGLTLVAIFSLLPSGLAFSEILATQQAKLTATDTFFFGFSVAVAGNTAVVGNPFADDGGSASVFVRAGTTWTQQAKLTADDAVLLNNFFGNSVAMDGDTVVVGGQLINAGGFIQSGAAYVFVRTGTTWTQQAKLTATDGATRLRFGSSVAVAGDTVVVGDPPEFGSDKVSGAAYVFVHTGATWTQQAKLTAADAARVDRFGSSVAVAGDTVVVGSFSDDVGEQLEAGSASVFVRTGTTWTQQAKLTAADAVLLDSFGGSVTVAGNTVVVGSGGRIGRRPGAAYVFVRTGTTWTQQAKLTGSARGVSVAVAGDTLVVGSSAAKVGPLLEAGAAYVFVRTGTAWTQQAKLTAADAAPLDHFGGSVTVAGNTVVVGSIQDDNDDGEDSGAAYVFSLVASDIVAAVLPSSRSVQVGTTATAFGLLINGGTTTATSCSVTPSTNIPATFSYQTTDPTTNALAGSPNTPVDLPAGALQAFVMSFTPTAAFSPTDVALNFSCTNTASAPSTVGLNTLLLSASDAPVPDIVALVATPTNDGVIHLPGATGGIGSTGVFVVASLNVGATGTMTVSADTGNVSLPLAITLCQTDTATGACLAPPGSNVTTDIVANTTPSFGVFVEGLGPVPFDPGVNRIFIRFKEAGTTRGSTSVAVQTQ